MDYDTALSRLYALSSRGIDLGLDRVRRASALLGSPHQHVSTIQIGGTNGKGSIATLISAAAKEAGLTTGLYTSPHLHRFTERIRINGDEANKDLLAEVLNKILDLTDPPHHIPLTFFEVATLAAFYMFSKLKVDLAILEVGLGGRLDATSISSPKACVISSIGLDHTALLGNTIQKIAFEKAGIIKHQVPVFVGPVQPEALFVIEQKAKECCAPLFLCGRDFPKETNISLSLPGAHQLQNCSVAAKVYQYLKETFDSRLTDEAFHRAATTITWPGRYEIIETSSRFILDGAHNLEAMNALVETLQSKKETIDTIIFGTLQGKPTEEMYALIAPLASKIVIVPPPIDRAFDSAAFASKHALQHAPSISDALYLLYAKKTSPISPPWDESSATQTVLVTGSLFTVAEARKILLEEESDEQIGL